MDRCISNFIYQKSNRVHHNHRKELLNLEVERLDEDEDIIDLDTMPDKKHVGKVGRTKDASRQVPGRKDDGKWREDASENDGLENIKIFMNLLKN